jgi:hypothetical protein
MPEKSEAKENRWRSEHIPEEAYAHLRSAHAEMRESVSALFPPEFIEHRRAARKEMLLAAQSFINRAIERIEAREEKAK